MNRLCRLDKHIAVAPEPITQWTIPVTVGLGTPTLDEHWNQDGGVDTPSSLPLPQYTFEDPLSNSEWALQDSKGGLY